MQSLNTNPNADDLIGTPYALIADAILATKTDPEKTQLLTDTIKVCGADSDAARNMAALKAAKDDEARDELKRLLDESGRKQLPLMPLDRDHAAMLAAKFSITNREVGDWRRRSIVEMASKGRITDEDIERAVFTKGIALDQLTAQLVKDGKLVRDGQGYRTPETAPEVTVA